MAGRPRRYSKSAATRALILQSAAKCLSLYGYTGTTLSRVAELAGMSRGPCQYYFPSKIDLIVAVWENIQAGAADFRETNLADASTPQESLDLIIDRFMETAGSDQHLANLEIKLALRGDDELAAALQDRIEASEDAADERWVEWFKDSGASRESLLTAYHTLVGIYRGLGIERVSRRSSTMWAHLEPQTRALIHSLVFPDADASR